MKIFFRFFIYILFILNYISYVNSQQGQNPLQKFKCTSPNHNLKVGDEVILCIHVPELKKKVAFKLKVDEYSAISIENGFNKIVLPKEESNLGRLLIEEDPKNNTSDDEIKEQVQFVGQIGNITSAYPSVSFLKIYYFYLLI